MFNARLIITFAPNTSGQPPDVNPAYNPIADICKTKIQELRSAQLLDTIVHSGSVTTMLFQNAQAAADYQNFFIEVYNDFNQILPEFAIENVA